MSNISIIVPIYNAEKYLDKCITSLLRQSERKLELILINDGSTDNSEQIIKSYKDKRIKYVKQKNQGIGATRNKGIALATSPYIMFIDSDDYISPNMCKVMYEKIHKDQLDMVVCDYYKVEKEKLSEQRIIKFKDTNLDKNKNLLLDINLAPWNKIYRTDFLKKNKITFSEELKYEDTFFVIQCLDMAKKIGKVNRCFNYYVVHKKSETTVRDKRVFDILEVVEQIREYFKERKDYQKVIDELTLQILLNYTIQQRYQKDFRLAKKFICKSFSYIRGNIVNYKGNRYFKRRPYFKAIIEQSEALTIIYCFIYRTVLIFK